jgi:hypothetical protein
MFFKGEKFEPLRHADVLDSQLNYSGFQICLSIHTPNLLLYSVILQQYQHTFLANAKYMTRNFYGDSPSKPFDKIDQRYVNKMNLTIFHKEDAAKNKLFFLKSTLVSQNMSIHRI